MKNNNFASINTAANNNNNSINGGIAMNTSINSMDTFAALGTVTK